MENRSADHIYWGLTPTGNFTVKSMYTALENSLPQTTNYSIKFYWIWKLSIHPKIKTFIWLLYHNRLPTRQFLTRLKIITESTCPYCQEADETLNHLFLSCVNAKRYWEELGLGRYINALLHLDNTQQWLHQLINYKYLKLPYNINSHTFLPFKSLEYLDNSQSKYL